MSSTDSSRKASHKPTLERPFPRRTPPGAQPGEFRLDPHAPPPLIEYFGCGADHCVREIVSSPEMLPGLLAQHPLSWVNIDGLGDEQVVRRLAELFQIHPLALEDVVHAHQRAKVEEYPGWLFVVMRMTWLNDTLESEQLSLFIREGCVVTFQERPGDSLAPVRKRLEEPVSPLRGQSSDHLAYVILDAVVDGYFPVIERYGEWIAELEDRIPLARGNAVIGEVHALRRALLHLRRCIWPLREVLSALQRSDSPLVSADARLHLRDTYDHSVQLLDVVENYREMSSDLRDYYFAVVSQRTNDVMKVLTIMATIFIPMNFIAALYGMNFDTHVSEWNMPELTWRLGYPFALSVMLSIPMVMLWFFHRRGWLGAWGRDEPEDDSSFSLQSLPVRWAGRHSPSRPPST